MLWQVTCGTVKICELWNVDVVAQVERNEMEKEFGFSAMLIVTGHFRSRFSTQNIGSPLRLGQVRGGCGVRGEKFGHGEVMMVQSASAGVLLRTLIFKFEAWPHQIETDLAISTTHPR